MPFRWHRMPRPRPRLPSPVAADRVPAVAAPAAPAAPATAAPPARAASPRRARPSSAAGSSAAGSSGATGGGTTGCSSVVGSRGPSTRSKPSGSSAGGAGAVRVTGRPSTWREGQGATWRAKSPGLVGPWSSLRVSRQMASRSRGTPAAISEGAATPPGTRGAAPSPEPPAPSGHRPVRPAYVRATTPTASRRAASSASVTSSPTRTAAVSRPRRRMSPSGVRRTSSGLRSRWCMPRWRADSRAAATSPVIRRTSSPGTPPSVTSSARVRASSRFSSTT